MAELRHLVIVLGDQLDADAAAFDGFDPAHDAVWMAEVAEESTHVWSSQPRTALFLAAMRLFADELRARGRTVHQRRLDDNGNRGTLAAELVDAVQRLRPQRLLLTAPGDWRVWRALNGTAQACGVPLEVRDDRHFFSTVRDFAAHAGGRRQLRMEFWYREQRVKHGVLIDGAGRPEGGRWNFDADNRQGFGPAGPVAVPPRLSFTPDAGTREVLALVQQRFGQHSGRLDHFDWPLTRAQALQALDHFVQHRLPFFGRWQDAMWPGQPWLWHAQISAALNLKLLQAREVVAAAEAAYRNGHAPLPAAEGFIRQVLGWREYVRGIYWTQMPGYAALNALHAQAGLPRWYWTGDTDRACLHDAIAQTLDHGYAHHIQRLMVTGLYALLAGVQPQQVHAWYLAVYVDAVEWVELPNTLGMSQYADGGLMASKPYAASGRYIQRMSGGALCRGCRFDPARRTGDKACPFTTLYGAFLLRHQALLARNPRMALPLQQAARLDDGERLAIQRRADELMAADA
jgi:deoxyribodipyrimidine photolyase-related protein